MTVPAVSVTVRHATVEDAEALAHLHGLPKAVAGTLQTPYPTVAGWRARLEPPQGVASYPATRITLVACDGDAVVGCGFIGPASKSPRRRHAANLGVVVHDDWHGRGVGTRIVGELVSLADDWLAVTRLELEVYTDNEAAVRLYRRHGFEVEGTLRNYSLRAGEWCDVFAMARLHGFG